MSKSVERRLVEQVTSRALGHAYRRSMLAVQAQLSVCEAMASDAKEKGRTGRWTTAKEYLDNAAQVIERLALEDGVQLRVR